MKKIGKILVGAILGIAFAGGVGVYCWQHDVGGIQKLLKEEETESAIVQSPKPKIPEQKSYELGEEIDCNGLIWTIHSAEIVQDYDSLDEYYHERPQGLSNPSELVKSHFENCFAEEMQFLVIKATLTNASQVHKEYSCSNMRFYNLYEDEYEEALISLYGSDVKCVSETGEIKQIENRYDPFPIEGGETLEVEYVIQYCEYLGYVTDFNYIYDLYLSTHSLMPASGNGYYNEIDHKICLNIAPKHLGADRTELENSYEEQRNVPEMKCRQWTNPEMKNYQREGYPTLYQKEDVVKEFKEEVTEENYLFFCGRSLNTQIVHAQTVDWESLPEDFMDRGALQKMAECYEQSYGYSRNQMKILLLDIQFSTPVSEESESAETYGEDFSTYDIDFYPYTYLYTRDENEKRWVFGTADDWIVTKNSVEGGRTGHINTEHLVDGQIVTLQAAYLLPPEVYNEGALYFNGGEYRDIDFFEQPIQKISL